MPASLSRKRVVVIRMVRKKEEPYISFSKHSIGDDEIRSVVSTLRSDWVTRGPRTQEFEEDFKRFVGSRHAVALSSCTAALHLSLLALDVGEGDEVITTPYTFAATVNVIVHQRAKPVLVDIESDTMNIDPAEIEEGITDRTKAVIAVDIAGHPCQMDKINKISKKNGIPVVEDAAHSLGAKLNGETVGSLADTTCFSFYATKNLTTGDGGMLTTDDDGIAEAARISSLHGISKDAWRRYSASGSWKYEIASAGYKYNMTDIQAAIGIHQLKKLGAMQRRRREIAGMYSDAFSELKEATVPACRKDVEHAWHLYPLRIDSKRLRVDRDEIIEILRKAGIGTSVHFIPIHLHPFYRKEYGFRKGDFPVAERAFEQEISLPIYPKMTDAQVRKVIAAVTDAVRKNRK